MCGTIINTRCKNHNSIALKKDREKIKRSKICIGCEHNEKGYCLKHVEWCFKTNYICLGTINPYEYKIPQSKHKVRNIK